MKYPFVLLLLWTLCLPSLGQVSKKGPLAKPVINQKVIPILKVPFLKRYIAIDPAIISAKSIDTTKSGSIKLSLKLTAIKSAKLTISDAAYAPIKESIKLYRTEFDRYAKDPAADGYTFREVYTLAIKFDGGYADFLEYKLIYHGNAEQQKKEKEVEEMLGGPNPLLEDFPNVNNKIVRIYFLNYTVGEDIGYIMMLYEANYNEDKKNDGSKILKSIVDGISKLKVNEIYSFSKVTDSTFLFDIAMPTPNGQFGKYNFAKPSGTISMKSIEDASSGYATLIEDYTPNVGIITYKSEIRKYTLKNGITIFSRAINLKWKEDGLLHGKEFVTMLLPDKKIIKKPVLFVLRLYNDKTEEGDAINAFILNSISPKGTLNAALMGKLSDKY